MRTDIAYEHLRYMQEQEKKEWMYQEIAFPKNIFHEYEHAKTFLVGELVKTMCEHMSYKELRNMIDYIIDKLPYVYNKERMETHEDLHH